MFDQVDIPARQSQSFLDYSDPALTNEVLTLAEALKPLRFVHLNATASGGGVAEILRSLVPLMRALGLQTDWFVLKAPQPFFQTTKKIHNLLQGQEGSLSPEELDLYLSYSGTAADLEAAGMIADVWLLHDPQLLPLARHIRKDQRQVACWICHIDLSAPNHQTLDALLPLMATYDALSFHKAAYVPPSLRNGKVYIMPPAIDPSSEKNTPLSEEEAKAMVAERGIDPKRPLVTQVSRFDKWKDPWGVIDAYRMAKTSVPNLQLALLGVIEAKDDPEALEVVSSVMDYASHDPDIHLFWDPQPFNGQLDRAVNAFQVASQVVVQKSTREGFGLTVAEAMWKRSPVIGGNVGGISDQIQDGHNGFLVSNPQECGQQIVRLLENPRLAAEMGKRAHQSVRLNYLMPRLLRDYLRMVQAHI